MKKFSERRKIVNQIPADTFYCYTPDIEKNAEARSNGEHGIYYINTCEFYKHKKGLYGKCKLYGCEVIDQVKSCGLRE